MGACLLNKKQMLAKVLTAWTGSESFPNVKTVVENYRPNTLTTAARRVDGVTAAVTER